MARPILPETLGFEGEHFTSAADHDPSYIEIGGRCAVWPMQGGGYELWTGLEAGALIRIHLCTNILEVVALLHAAGMPMKSP